MRNRGSVVIIQNGTAALIKRVKSFETYYVFPGGGIEPGETAEEAAVREAHEELGVTVQIKKCIAVIDFKGKQYFYSANILAGNIGEGLAEEFIDLSRGTYEPVWIPLEKFPFLDIRPREAAKEISESYSSAPHLYIDL
jgi:8-oxo-dGTP diphosphatase